MRQYYSQDEFNEISTLVNAALDAPSKSAAKVHLDQLNPNNYVVLPPSRNILCDLIAWTDSASGRIKDKKRLVEEAKENCSNSIYFV